MASLKIVGLFFFAERRIYMLKKAITYVDYNGVERTESFYFNLSKAEMIEMEFSTVGTFTSMIQNIIDAQDEPELIKLFKSLILKSYGKKSADGRRFEKSEEISKDFSETEAYVILFMELARDSKAASEFVNGIIPADIDREELKKQQEALMKKNN